MKCSISRCMGAVRTMGWCKPHYDAWHRTGNPLTYRGDRSNLSTWDKILEIGFVKDPISGCLEYQGFRNELGYGLFRTGSGLVRVHRVAYENLVGPLSDQEKILHRCDNPKCSEPTHLSKGSQADNIRDMRAKKRGHKDNWTHCPNGHEYPPHRPALVDKNRCRHCANERSRRYYLRKKGASNAMACS